MKGDGPVIAHLQRQERAAIGIPHPVIAEISYGIERLPRSKRRDALARRFDLLKEEIQRVEWSDKVSDAFGTIKAALERRGERIEDFDAAVAARAIAEGAVLVTANIKHMTRVPELKVEDWSESG
jgi:tRNA(fMet)-specific endonuclease VapC